MDKGTLALWFDVSMPTIDTWIKQGMPVVARGGKGRQWEFDNRECAKWRFGKEVNYDPTSVDPYSLPTNERKTFFEAELRARELDQLDGRLIPSEVYRTALADCCKLLVAHLESLPDQLEKKADVPPAGIELSEGIINGLRQAMYEAMIG
jgi:phage terminase Nu1 subunit (DNA packaging protein)